MAHPAWFDRTDRKFRCLHALLVTVILIATLSLMLRSVPASADPLFAPFISFATASDPQTAAIGDLNGDGKADLVVANAGAGTVSVFLGNGDGTFGAESHYPVGDAPSSIAIADLNGDGTPDLVVSNLQSNTVSALLGNGNGTFRPRIDYGTISGPGAIAIADLNGDGKPDLAVATSANTVSVLLGRGDGIFWVKRDFGTGNVPSSVAIGDLNGDGKPDLAVANEFSATVSVLLGHGDGTFGVKTDYGTGMNPRSVAIGDLSRDGYPDLAVANWGSDSVSVLLGIGNGTFGARTDYATGSHPPSVAIGDLNGDSRLDLAVANRGSKTVSVLLGNGNGEFGSRTDYGTGGGPESVVIGDLNGDSKPDLAVVNPSPSNTVSVLLNVVGMPTAVEISLVTASSEPGRVELEWFASTSLMTATVYRRGESEAWAAIGRVAADVAGHLRFEDHAVEAGHRYGYRLGIQMGGEEHFAAETWVEVPIDAHFALEGLRPNPAVGALVVAMSLPSAMPARLELMDVSGRQLQAQELRGLGPGGVLVRLDGSARVRPGLYFLRLSQGARSLVSRVTVMR